MDDAKNMWDFPMMEGVSFQNANRVHPLMQARIEKLLQSMLKDKNVRKLVLLGSSLEFRCNSNSDIDIYIEKKDRDKKAKVHEKHERGVSGGAKGLREVGLGEVSVRVVH